MGVLYKNCEIYLDTSIQIAWLVRSLYVANSSMLVPTFLIVKLIVGSTLFSEGGGVCYYWILNFL